MSRKVINVVVAKQESEMLNIGSTATNKTISGFGFSLPINEEQKAKILNSTSIKLDFDFNGMQTSILINKPIVGEYKTSFSGLIFLGGIETAISGELSDEAIIGIISIEQVS